MKNTKHTEMNDSSIEQENQETLSQSKRKILTSIGVTSGVVGASALVPSTWVKPAVNSVILPAHAQSTPPAGGTDGSGYWCSGYWCSRYWCSRYCMLQLRPGLVSCCLQWTLGVIDLTGDDAARTYKNRCETGHTTNRRTMPTGPVTVTATTPATVTGVVPDDPW